MKVSWNRSIAFLFIYLFAFSFLWTVSSSYHFWIKKLFRKHLGMRIHREIVLFLFTFTCSYNVVVPPVFNKSFGIWDWNSRKNRDTWNIWRQYNVIEAYFYLFFSFRKPITVTCMIYTHNWLLSHWIDLINNKCYFKKKNEIPHQVMI